MKAKQLTPIINIVLIIATAALLVSAYLNPGFALTFYIFFSYYLILGLFILLIIVVLQSARYEAFDYKAWFRTYRTGILVSLLIASIVFISVTPMFRVLADETNLLGVSKSMIYGKQTYNGIIGKWYYDNFYLSVGEVDKRPLFFPFSLSLVHTILGYHPENAIVFNYLVFFSFLLLIYVMARNAFGNIWAISAIILVACQPIVVQCATSGGFDLLSALFFIICFFCLKAFLERPSSISRFQLLWINLLIFASIRYEGIISFVLVFAILMVFKYVKSDFFKKDINVIYFYTPLALLPNYLAAILIKNPFESKANDVVFSAGYFVNNYIDLFKTLLDFRYYLPYSAILNSIGLIAVFYFIYNIFGNQLLRNNGKKHLILISSVCLLMNLSFYACYFRGLSRNPATSRYFMIYAVLLSILALIFMHSISYFKKRPAYVLLLSIMIFVLYHPVSVEDRFSRTQALPWQYRFAMHYLKQEARKNNNSFVVVTDRPGMYTVNNYGAVNFKTANSNNDLLEGFNNHLYRDIFVIQQISYKTKEPVEENLLDNKYLLKPIKESQINDHSFIRISRVLHRSQQPQLPSEPVKVEK